MFLIRSESHQYSFVAVSEESVAYFLRFLLGFISSVLQIFFIIVVGIAISLTLNMGKNTL